MFLASQKFDIKNPKNLKLFKKRYSRCPKILSDLAIKRFWPYVAAFKTTEKMNDVKFYV